MNFILLGAAGYVAPKHMKAIKDVGGNLLAAYDPHDSVGVLDSHFPQCKFFSNFELFDRYCSKRSTPTIDYTVICSPNWLHDSHCRFGMRIGSNVICEKPLVLHERHIDELKEFEKKYDKKVNTILQLRLSKKVQELKKEIDINKPEQVNLTYHTPRGDWYYYSWKLDEKKSGGILFNIGVHLFDILMYLFGEKYSIEESTILESRAYGIINFSGTKVYYDLSIEADKKANRSIEYSGGVFSFSEGFENLHTESYKHVLNKGGFGLETVRKTIRLIEDIKKS